VAALEVETMTEDEDRWVLPREDIPPNGRPDDVKGPPVEPVPDGGGQGSLDLPGNDGDLDVGDPPTRDDLGEPVMRQAGR
jgi:hypothetical protein